MSGERMGLWMYCIVEGEGAPALESLGIHGTSMVSAVSDGAFSAIVSREPMKKYPLVRDYLIAHERVCEEAMKARRVLPVKFCTIAESEGQIVEEVLRPKAGDFRAKLADIAAKDEYGLRARWKDIDRVYRDVGAADEGIRERKAGIVDSGRNDRNELIDIGHMVREAVEKKNEGMAKDIFDELKPLAADSRRNPTLGDMNILNAAFLVAGERQSAFDAAVERIVGRYGDEIYFKYVGPVPPFNFVEIVIEWGEGREGKRA